MEGSAAGEEEGRFHDRRSDRAVRRIGLSVSVAVHVLLVALVAFPPPEAPSLVGGQWELRHVEVPPLVDIPPAPEAIRRPPEPEVVQVSVGGPEAPEGRLEPPPTVSSAPEPPRVQAIPFDERPALAPPEVSPSLEAPDHFRRRLERRYPRLLRDRGVGGIVRLQFFVDPRGRVSRVEVAESSGHGSLDRVARQLAGEMEFLPALNRDRAVGVWVSQRICFITVDRRGENPRFAECEHRVALGGP